LIGIVLTTSVPATATGTMIYTANQSWLSRIYVLDAGGNVLTYHEYDFYRFVGMEVVAGELYIAEAFAPRVYKVDPLTGDLDVFIDDWSLYYIYDVAFDGTYFYVDEWDLNRYDIDGNYAGTASFDEYVLGCAWDGTHLWTLDDTNLIKCWDLSTWPNVTAVTALNFTPPSAQCRGLWFDGEYFWSAETGDSLGQIFQFDHTGQVMRQWLEPAYSGWGAVRYAATPTSVDLTGDQQNQPLVKLDNFPDPFNPTTMIRIELTRSTAARLSIYDVAGRLVQTLHEGELGQGRHEYPWRADGLASGVYFSRLEMDGRSLTDAMVLVK
jgi:hypothetical protein